MHVRRRIHACEEDTCLCRAHSVRHDVSAAAAAVASAAVACACAAHTHDTHIMYTHKCVYTHMRVCRWTYIAEQCS